MPKSLHVSRAAGTSACLGPCSHCRAARDSEPPGASHLGCRRNTNDLQRIDTPHIQRSANVGRGSRVRRSISSCRFAQFNAVAVHPLVMRVRADPRVLAAQVGMALDFSPRTEFTHSRSCHEQLGAILDRSLRRVLWAGSLHARHIGWAGAAQLIKLASAQASRPLEGNRRGQFIGDRRSVSWLQT